MAATLFRLAHYGVVTIWVILLFPTLAETCSCRPPEAIEKEIETYPLIFLGQVIKVVSVDTQTIEAELQVLRVWKGTASTTLKVRTASISTACGSDFIAKQQYVVFAYKEGSSVGTNSCTPTQSKSGAAKLVALLDKRFGAGN